MSVKANALKNLYRRHKITIDGLRQAVADGVITQEEYEWIIS